MARQLFETLTQTFSSPPYIVPIIDIVTRETKLPKPIISKGKRKKTLLINLPKIKSGAINGNTKNVKVKYLIHIRKLKRLGNQDRFFKLGKKFLTYERKNEINLKNMDKGIYSIRYQVVISNSKKSETIKRSKRTLTEI